jgi:hypothetical protein
MPTSPSGFSSRLYTFFGSHLRRSCLASLEATFTPERDGGRVFPGVGIKRLSPACRLVDELLCKRVDISWSA